jgi:hypothetical protein
MVFLRILILNRYFMYQLKCFKPALLKRKINVMFLKVTGGYRKAGTSFVKGLVEGFLQLGSDFIEASRNFILDVLHKKIAKNCEKHYFKLKSPHIHVRCAQTSVGHQNTQALRYLPFPLLFLSFSVVGKET